MGPDFRAAITQSTHQAFTENLAEAVRQETGLFKGEQVVVVKDAMTAAAENAEEVGFQNIEKLESSLKKRSEGKEKTRMNAAELAAYFVNRMYDPEASKKLQGFLEDLQQKKGRNLSEGDIRQMAREYFEDVSDQYAALEFAAQSLEGQEGNEQLLEQVKKAKESLLKEAGPAIRAGLNVIRDVLEFSKRGIAEPNELRDLYRTSILGKKTVAEMYQGIMKRYGEGQFEQALSFLIQAASNDLSSHGMGSSIETPRLETAINDISHVQYIGNLHRNLKDLLERVNSKPQQGLTKFSRFQPQQRNQVNAHGLMTELLDMTIQRWVGPERFIELTNRSGAQTPEMRIYFLTQLKEKVRQIPLKLFPTPDIRDKMLEALQQAMDSEIAKEEVA